ncbi:MAG TPA: plastocyanin/azurin family copper-binding protein [Rubricoccaceae bacterium]|nr:plastocyanin/azurin family copper-binding protein [Rubricoccaceae bacterium]
MRAIPPRALRPYRALPALLLAATLLAQPAASTTAQSFLDRSPNLGGTWVGEPGVLHFHFLHRFSVSDGPAHKVSNTPTFLLSASLPFRTMVGARYATNSALAQGFPNEWEFFGRYSPLVQESGAPLDVALHAGYNHAADSFDGEVSVARRVGPVRLIAAGRAFSDYARAGDARYAVAGGASVRLHRWVSVAGDVATLLDREDEEEIAWGAGVHVQIPYSPHTLSLHVASPTTTTLQGASGGLQAMSRFGFEFTIPITLARYFGSPGGSAPAGGTGAAADVPLSEDPVVTMSNTLGFEPNTVRIKAGETVRWRNTSALVHTVTVDPAKAVDASWVQLPRGAEPFDSGDIAPGDEFSHTFTVAGTYKYFCVPHAAAGMVGFVVVEP